MGGYLGGVVALAGLWIRRREPIATVTLLVAAAFPVGYFVFWGTYLSSLASRISGPIYLVPLYGVVCILAAAAIDHWWNHSGARSPSAVLAVLAVTTVPGAVTRFDVNREISEQQEPWRESVRRRCTNPSLVLRGRHRGLPPLLEPVQQQRPRPRRRRPLRRRRRPRRCST